MSKSTSNKNTRYRLGLDVGTSSLGWSVLELDNKDEVCAIKDCGVRIFSEGREPKSLATLAATRRTHRSARRMRDRAKQRQQYLTSALEKHGLFPKEEKERKELQTLNPLRLRALALTEKLTPHEIGRALFHINQRRGFKSNRKDQSEEARSGGKVSRSVELLLQDMKLIDAPQEDSKLQADTSASYCKLRDMKELSYGSFLYQRHKNGEPTRARPDTRGDGKLYDVYPTRELYEDEFDKIWSAQKAYHSSLMTDEAYEEIRKVIFTQRPLKSQMLGKCAYMKDEDRTYRAMPSFQRYRIRQEVNSLEWTVGSQEYKLRNYPEACAQIVALHEKPTTKRGNVTFGKAKKVIERFQITDASYEFNYEAGDRSNGFDGNLTSNLMQREEYVGEDWHKWGLDKQDDFIALILGDKKDDEVLKELQDTYSLSPKAAENCLMANFQGGTAHISLKAARLMLEEMEKESVDTRTGEVCLPLQSDAAEIVADKNESFKSPHRKKKYDEGVFTPKPSLLYYGEVFQDGRHIIPGRQDESDKGDERKFWGGITNPTVHIALNQIRRVVNELMHRYGHPYSIAIELGRDLPRGAEERLKVTAEIRKNREKGEELDEIAKDFGQNPNRDNRLRVKLWEELSEDPQGRRCPYSGIVISKAMLFSDECNVEHILPFSRTLDNSNANKTLSSRKANQDKGRMAPYEAFGDSPGDYNWEEICERAKSLPLSKQWRFKKDAMEIWEGEKGFTDRHLNDTRYIGRIAREYLEEICHIDRINVVTGRLTGLLRGQWGLNTVLGEKGKNRNDHRHHAIDAIVIGMTTKSMIQEVSAKAAEAEDFESDRLFLAQDDKESPIDPWHNFRRDVGDAVSKVVVSHKVRNIKLSPKATSGELHEETVYGVVLSPNQDEKRRNYLAVVRRPIDYFATEKHIEKIRDEKLRQYFLKAYNSKDDQKGKVEAFKEAASKKGIRRLRCLENKSSLIPIKGKDGKDYKAFVGGNNHCIEIYSFPKGHKKYGKWEGIVISRFDIHQKGFRFGHTKRPHPSAKVVMRLQQDSLIEVTENNQTNFWRLQKINSNGQMCFAEHNEANVDKRNRDTNDDFKFILITPNPLKEYGPRKAHISPSGQISYEDRKSSKQPSGTDC